jgi:ABC-type glycerol-3-phosphate transport system substrate-binding protein
MTHFLQDKRGLSKVMIMLVLGGIVAVLLGVVLIFFSSKNSPAPKRVTLTMWGVMDESSNIASMISSYRASHPYINIIYTKKRLEEYEDALIKGWANEPSTGPDIYALPNSWVNKYRTLYITPMPATTKIAFYTTKKILFKSETKINYVTKNSLTAADIKRNFIDAIYGDVIFDNKITALPLGVNTLVMYYNNDLLKQAHLVEPPQTWSEFRDAVTKLIVVNGENTIVRAGTALGTYDNIPRATDILSLLMLQNGTMMTSGSRVTLNMPSTSDAAYFPAEEALRFYTDFARPEKSVYTWNNDIATNALDYFAQGNLFCFFGYRYQEADIRSRAPGLDFGIAPVPQIDPNNEVNFVNYWVYTVAKKTKGANEAWAFIQYMADAKRAKPYVERTGQTSALKSVLTEQSSDPDLGALALQALTAQSWYHGRDPQSIETAFAEMIKTGLNNAADIRNAVTLAAQKLQQTY